ncbi:uroporphyrinogen-III synthase [Spiribacter halobius]|uniref:Uroporphyrinogen-III synthase n=1 Tax=Sediminicurvatus halobius TaxID=2182432 RepID=A0A2U2MWZ0_9GAMM|nr:uroporphyrinogen-III synthase [Spiribacter halobius]PWG61370.1 hypothetical protein DEM34_16770 [Spiribacter halobius]UEX76585.1 uroporphyrinogen-III synthase [Spiribacter halobius]
MITRPQPYCGPLASALESAGADVFTAPMIRLLPPADTATLDAVTKKVEAYHLLLFSSPAAAAAGIAYLHARGPLPARLLIGAIGPGTAAMVNRWGYEVDVCGSTPFDSEAFLSSFPSVDLEEWNIAIFRAQSGRNVLANALRERGARVTFVQVYRRDGPSQANQARARSALRAGVDVILISSSEGFHNLLRALTPHDRSIIRRTLVLAGHHRIGTAVRNAGVPRVLITDDPTDATMVDAMLKWSASRKGLILNCER